MRYEHEPRPEIEHHYHIRELIEAQEKRSDDRTYHRNKEKAKEDRNDIIRDAKMVVLTDWWCEDCREDFKAQAIKEVEVDWTNPSQFISFYKTKHWCGKWCMRFVTDRHKDPYWFKSRAVHKDQGEHYEDTLQPYQTGFNTLYKKI